MSLAAAAPFNDLAIRRNGSSFAEKFDPKSIVEYIIGEEDVFGSACCRWNGLV